MPSISLPTTTSLMSMPEKNPPRTYVMPMDSNREEMGRLPKIIFSRRYVACSRLEALTSFSERLIMGLSVRCKQTLSIQWSFPLLGKEESPTN